MAKQHNGLGRGLDALFQRTDGVDSEASAVGAGDTFTESVDGNPGLTGRLSDGSYLEQVAVADIFPNPQQPRQVFDEDQLSELAASITEVGVLQPVVVRKVQDSYELVMGERRWRAAREAGLSRIPAIVRGTPDGDLLRDALLENLHRAQLNPLEEAGAYQQMLEDFGCTQEELSQRIKRSRPQISNTIRLLKLPAPVQRRVAAGVLSAGHARALLVLEEPVAQEQLAQRIVAEGLSVRATEELVTLSRTTPAAAQRSRRTTEPDPRAVELSSVLSDHFDTRVKVDIGHKKGKIVIEFAGHDDLDRILMLVDASEHEMQAEGSDFG